MGDRLRVCLVNPPSPFLLDERVFPPLGLLQVAAALEDAGHEPHVVDLAGSTDPGAEMRRWATQGWDAYGLTGTTPQFPAVVHALQEIRATDPGKRVILGGPHATVMPESCGMFDCVVRGDGEDAILEALDPGSPAVIDRATTVTKGVLPYREPARHLLDFDSYRYTLNGRKATSMMFSHGCPYSCRFCSGRDIAYYRRVRTRPVVSVIREIERLRDAHTMRGIMAFDDEVNLLTDPLRELCVALRPLGMLLRGFIKANLFTDQQAEMMAAAGFVELCTGAESGSARILGIIQKETDPAINARFVELCHKHGMRAKLFCSIGHPGETLDSALATRDWLLMVKPDDFDLTVISVLPGTPLWNQREPVGLDADGRRVCQYVMHSRQKYLNGATLFFHEVDYAADWAFYKGRPHEYISHVWTPALSREAIAALRDEIEDEVRTRLELPYPTRYSGDHIIEHTMGMGATTQDSRAALAEVL